MKCPNCGVDNLEGIRFCNYCGKEFPKVAPAADVPRMMKCPNCGFNNPDGSVFCNQCGKDMRVSIGPTVASPLSNTKPCNSCGRMIPIDANICPYCRFNFKAQPMPFAPPAPPQPAFVQAQQPSEAIKPCTSCGRMIPADANLCPYCRYNYRAQAAPAAPAPMGSIAPAQPAYQPQPAQLYPQYPPQSAGSKPCVFCGKSIPVDANLCPYCMYKYRK